MDRLYDVFARESAIVHPGARWPEYLGENLEALPPLIRERLAQHLLRLGLGIDIRGIERGDALLKRGSHAGNRRVLFNLRAMGDPIAVRDFTNDEAALAKVSMIHAASIPEWRFEVQSSCFTCWGRPLHR